MCTCFCERCVSTPAYTRTPTLIFMYNHTSVYIGAYIRVLAFPLLLLLEYRALLGAQQQQDPAVLGSEVESEQFPGRILSGAGGGKRFPGPRLQQPRGLEVGGRGGRRFYF